MLNTRNSLQKSKAILLRKNGLTHREIARDLNISLGSAHLWTVNIRLTKKQKMKIERRRNKARPMGEEEKRTIKIRLKPYQYKNQYTEQDLLDKIRVFYKDHGRIPIKREFNAWRIYAARFGSWNKAILAAGFDINPILFAKKFIANDGHRCDSFTEKIIDDWLFKNGVQHERHARYGNTRFTADFVINHNIIVEFFGLAGVKQSYDSNIKKKRQLSKKLGCKLFEIFPNDIYPKNKLPTILSPVIFKE